MAIRLPSLMPKVGPRLPGGPALRLFVFTIAVALLAGGWLMLALRNPATKPAPEDAQKLEALPPRLDIGIVAKPPFSTEFKQFGQRPIPAGEKRANPFQP